MQRAVWRLLTTDTWIVDALLWWKAFNWFLTLALAPNSSFSTLSYLSPLMAIKWWWVGPALLATVFPIIDLVAAPAWVAYLSRIYALGWWTSMFILLLILDPSVLEFWGGALMGVVLSLWTLFRQTAGRHAAST